MTKITLQRDILKAVSRFMAKEDIRYYLNGVKVEVFRAVAYLVATDGHRLAVARVEGSTADPWEPCEAIIPGDALAVVLKSGSAAVKKLAVILTLDGDSFEFNACGAITAGKLIEGKFPDWRKVIPAKTSGVVSQFQPDYIADCQRAAEDLHGRHAQPVTVLHNGDANGKGHDSAALVRIREDFLAVIMPFRTGEAPAGEAPEWVREDSENVGRVLDSDAAHVEALAEALEMAWSEALAEYAARELNDGAGPIAYVSPMLADAFNMRGMPNVRIAA